MGTKLQELASLTNPGMAAWWQKYRLWLLGAGLLAALVQLYLILFYQLGPGG